MNVDNQAAKGTSGASALLLSFLSIEAIRGLDLAFGGRFGYCQGLVEMPPPNDLSS